MSYSIRYRQRAGSVASEHWTATLIEAKDHAMSAVTSGAAKRAEVRNASGRLVFHYPNGNGDFT